PPAVIDLERLEAWGRQLLLDADAGNAGAVAGDVAIMETIRDRFVHTLDPAAADRLTTALAELRGQADAKNLSGVENAVPSLLAALDALRSG
ncbi:MAG: hypothetical protein ACRDZ7_05200, partial [Acidimicrobiia bacterium]